MDILETCNYITWPLLLCTHDRTSDAQRSWRNRQKKSGRRSDIGEGRQARWRGNLSQSSLDSCVRCLSSLACFEDQDVAGLCKDDGRRVSVCLAVVRVAPELTLQHPLDVQQDLWWQDLEGPHWQRFHWQVVAAEPLEGNTMMTLGRRDNAPVLFVLGTTSAEAVDSQAQPLLQAWKASGVLGPHAELKLAMAVPKPLCLLLQHSSLTFVAVSMRRKLPNNIPDHALCARVKLHAEHVPDLPKPKPENASSELTSGAFKNLVQTMDGWASLLAAATAGSLQLRSEVSQEVSMMRGWASRLAYQLDPLYLASSRVQTSRLQQGVLGQGARLRVRAWAPRHLIRHRSAKMLAAIRSKPQQQQQLTGRYTSWFAIQAVMFSSFLRDSAKIQDALKQGIMMAFPQTIANNLLQMLEESPNPHAGTLSRWRVLFEAAACLQLRPRLAKFFNSTEPPQSPQHASVPMAMHVLVDSSPQGGRDWLLSEVHMLGHRVPLQKMLLLFWKVCELHPRAEDLDEDMCHELVAAEQELADAVEVLVLPPAGLGHQRSNLHHKLHGLIHSLWLAVGACLPQVVEAISSFTTDFGTESGMPGMEVASELVCPQLGQSCKSCFSDTDLPDQICDPWPLLSFARSLQVPGIHHVMHNICEDMCEALPSFRKHKPHFQAMSVFLCDHHVRQGLQERCFSQGDAAAHRAKFNSFGERLLDWRWQSVSSFLLAMEPLELPLRQFWNLQAFRAKAQDAQPHTSTSDQPDAEEAGPDDTAQVADALVAAGAGEGQVLAEAVRGKIRSQNFDLAVQNASVWQYMSMLRKLFAISDELLAWFQACPCHPPGEASEDDDLCKHYAACPMKGRRAPELAAGFIVDFMRERLQSAADVFPSNSDLFLEYVAGLQHFSFMLQLKFASWAAMPHSFLALAHPSERTARVACRRLLGEWEFLSEGDKQSAHPLCHAFMSDTSVRDSLVRFGQGSGRDSDDCVQMRAVLGPIAFLPVLERSIEGRHAVVKRATERAPNHRGAYVANVLRSAAIMDAAAKDPKMLVEMAEHFDRLRLPVFVIQHLGLKSNASVVALGRLPQKQADKQLQSFGFLDRVMFRLDAATQFADWEDFLDAKQRHSKGKLPLMVADANSMQRHLALEHFRVTATSSSDFFAATLQDAGPGTPATDFPFRQLQCTLAGNARFVDACLDDAGQVALIEADPQCGDGQGQGFAVAST